MGKHCTMIDHFQPLLWEPSQFNNATLCYSWLAAHMYPLAKTEKIARRDDSSICQGTPQGNEYTITHGMLSSPTRHSQGSERKLRPKLCPGWSCVLYCPLALLWA